MRGLLVTWLPARVSRSACRDDARSRGCTYLTTPSRRRSRCSAGWTSASPNTTPAPSTRQASGCTTRRCPTTRPRCGPCSVAWPSTAGCWSWSTSPPRSARWRSRSPASSGIEVAYLPGLAMRRIADLHPGQAKTDARDAYVIADAARTMPHTLRRVGGRRRDPRRARGAGRLRRRPRRAVDPPDQPAARRAAACSPCPGTPARAAAGPRWRPRAARRTRRPRPRCASSAPRAWPSDARRVRRGWHARCPPRSSPPWTRRASSFPAPPRSPGSSPGSPASSETSTTNAPTWPPSSRLAWRPTLLDRS